MRVRRGEFFGDGTASFKSYSLGLDRHNSFFFISHLQMKRFSPCTFIKMFKLFGAVKRRQQQNVVLRL